MLGDRVRHARSYHGWTQGRLAELVGVTQPAISQIEKGGPASEDTLAQIASATQFAPSFFIRGPLPDLPAGSLRWRKRASARVRDDERVRAHVRQALELLGDLEMVADGPPVRIRPVPQARAVDFDVIEAIAIEAREWLGCGPLDPIPNLMRAVERAGVPVIGSSHEIEKHDGASYWPNFPIGRPIIAITRGLPGDRERLSVGHELGHLVLHTLRQVDDHHDAEGEAFRFGGALLLPREAALECIETPVTLRQLAMVKARFGIAISALVRRCLDLQIINADRRLSLERQISARGWRKDEPVYVPNERPQLVRDFVSAVAGTTKPSQLHKRFGLPALAIRDLIS